MIAENPSETDSTRRFGPVRVTLTRQAEESVHLIDVVVCSVNGVLSTHGDYERSVIARSSLKPIQVIPLVQTGAADAFDLSNEQIALGAASHSAEAQHVRAVEAWLDRLDLDASALECGASRPLSVDEADRRLAAGETWAPIHNCCSGKHAGFLTIARHLGIDPTGYIEREHPVQQLVLDAIETFTGTDLSGAPHGIDGCGIPTHALPLESLALSMARLVDPSSLGSAEQTAAGRVVSALAAHPFWLSGTDRQEVRLVEVASEPLVIKTGAEGVFMAALPDRGVGLALKTRDGAVRAADLAVAAILEHLDVVPTGHAVAPVTNAAGTVVGSMQAHLS